jgi:hypothetical protein
MTKAKSLTGTQVQDALIELALTLGWKVLHIKPARLQSGNWVTPFSQGGKGFPDLFMLRNGWMLAMECKSQYEKVRPDQEEWLREFDKVEHCCSMIVRPSDYDTAVELIQEVGK